MQLTKDFAWTSWTLAHLSSMEMPKEAAQMADLMGYHVPGPIYHWKKPVHSTAGSPTPSAEQYSSSTPWFGLQHSHHLWLGKQSGQVGHTTVPVQISWTAQEQEEDKGGEYLLTNTGSFLLPFLKASCPSWQYNLCSITKAVTVSWVKKTTEQQNIPSCWLLPSL